MRVISFFVFILVSLPFTLLALSFALSNDQTVTLGLWPLTPDFLPKWETSLAVAGLGLMAVGFLAGAIYAGLWTQRLRLKLWQTERKQARLAKDLAVAEEALGKLREQTRLSTPVATPAQSLDNLRRGEISIL
jgi:uncharacterized membrane protein YciS (DUF1049 family)